MMACKDCAHPVMEGYPCPFCLSEKSVETCIKCHSRTIQPPGAEYPFCQNCTFEKGLKLS